MLGTCPALPSAQTLPSTRGCPLPSNLNPTPYIAECARSCSCAARLALSQHTHASAASARPPPPLSPPGLSCPLPRPARPCPAPRLTPPRWGRGQLPSPPCHGPPPPTVPPPPAQISTPATPSPHVPSHHSPQLVIMKRRAGIASHTSHGRKTGTRSLQPVRSVPLGGPVGPRTYLPNTPLRH